MEIIATHVASDFDSFAGMVAAKKIFPDAHIIIPSSINQNVREYIAFHEDSLPDLREISEIELEKVKQIIMVDTRMPSRLGPAGEVLKNDKIKIIVFDHHQKSSLDIRPFKNYYKKVGSTTTILVNKIKSKKIKINQIEATLFLLGIYEDTGNFTYANTSEDDFKAAAFLIKNGANLFVLSRFLNLSLNREQHKLFERLLINSKKIIINGREILFSSAVVNKYIEGLSVLTRKLSQVEEVPVVFCWVKMKGKIYLVGRSDDIEVDVSKILSCLGGGGHPLASSAVLKDYDFEKIEGVLTSSVYKNTKKILAAKNIMTSPVKVINENLNIAAAGEVLKKYGHSGIPIVDLSGNLSGIITRKDIDKAVKHGLSHAPVKGFKSGEIITVSPETGIDEIQKLMIENSIGRIPVMLKNKIVGIITRKDVLRFLDYKISKDNNLKSKTKDNTDYKNADIFRKFSENIPDSIVKILKYAQETAKNLDYRAYLVGGMVRDLILGRQNFDIDIVTEGDGLLFAKMLASKLKADLFTHKKFKTGVIVLKDKSHIDIATARTEFYEKPAALPNIEEGSIKQDLFRRDFTVNSMAVSLNSDNFGELIDYFGGIRDLNLKKIKAMHKLSFVEDPTRIFRAVRFEQRFSFKIDNQAEELIKHAVDTDIIAKLSGVRIRDELVSILEEKDPQKPLKRLYDFGALKKINLTVEISDEKSRYISDIVCMAKKLSVFYENNISMSRILLSVLLEDKSSEEIRKWCTGMKVRKRDADALASIVCKEKVVFKKINIHEIKNSSLRSILDSVPPELHIILSKRGGYAAANVKKYLKKLRNKVIEINGDDLVGMGFEKGSKIGAVLKELLDLKLDGALKTKDDEISYVLKKLSKF